MADLNNFDATTVDPMSDFEPVPSGKYLVVAIDSEYKPTKSGNGSYLEIKFQIIDGKFQNRLLWSRLNLNNPSEKAVHVARAQLSAICHAAGVLKPKDSIELHNLPLVVRVACARREDNGELANEIKGYEPKEAAQGKPQQADNGVPPWQRQ